MDDLVETAMTQPAPRRFSAKRKLRAGKPADVGRAFGAGSGEPPNHVS